MIKPFVIRILSMLLFTTIPRNGMAADHEIVVTKIPYEENHDKSLSWQLQDSVENELLARQVPIPFSIFRTIYYPKTSFNFQMFRNQYPDFAQDLVYLDYSSLVQGLETILPAFIKKLDGPYSVGMRPGKSSTWVAALALEISHRLNLGLSLPSSSWMHADDGSVGGLLVQNKYAPSSIKHINDRQFVLFDDVSYSGSQLAHILQTTLKSMQHREDISIYVVIPFMSEGAMKRIMQISSQNVRIEIITTDKKLPSHGDPILPWLSPKVRVITDWKIPDEVSFPEEFLNFFSSKSAIPPYRVSW